MKDYYIFFVLFVLVLAVGTLLAIYPDRVLGGVGISSMDYITAFQIVTILAFGLLSLRLLTLSIIAYGKKKQRMDETSVAKVTTLIGYVIIALFLLAALHFNITGLLVGAGFLGIVVGLASQSTLGNLFAGVSMMAAKPFATGDRVTFSTWQYGMLPPSHSHPAILPGYTGEIAEIGLMYTRIRMDEGTAIFVPNGILNQAVIINYTVSDIIDVVLRMDLALENDFEKVKLGIEKKVKENKRLNRILEDLEIRVMDIGTASYGVQVRGVSPIEQERFVQQELGKIVMGEASRLQKKH